MLAALLSPLKAPAAVAAGESMVTRPGTCNKPRHISSSVGTIICHLCLFYWYLQELAKIYRQNEQQIGRNNHCNCFLFVLRQLTTYLKVFSNLYWTGVWKETNQEITVWLYVRPIDWSTIVPTTFTWNVAAVVMFLYWKMGPLNGMGNTVKSWYSQKGLRNLKKS